MAVTEQGLLAALASVCDPHTGKDFVSTRAVRNVQISGGDVAFDVELGYPAQSLVPELRRQFISAAKGVAGVENVSVNIATKVVAHAVQRGMPLLPGVKNIIAVASGKGGVGKSTTAANLALALAREGARVGILDADIYGPSQGIMFGIAEGTRPLIKDQKWLLPIEAHGVQVMSMAFLADENTPMVWRGPMVSGALMQLISQTAWDNLDYLVVDMPPGTGDIQLTLAQKVPVAGAVIVTTPQDLALLDARKGVEMFRKVNIPVLGVVENMAVHICSNCGHAEHLFGEGGGEKLAAQYGVDLLASLPLSMAIRMQSDGGKPTTIADPESQIAMVYQELARNVGAGIAQGGQGAQGMPSIEISDD